MTISEKHVGFLVKLSVLLVTLSICVTAYLTFFVSEIGIFVWYEDSQDYTPYVSGDKK